MITNIQDEIRVGSVELEEDVLQPLLDSPKTSTRSVAPAQGVNNKTVRQVHEEIMHPFHILKTLELSKGLKKTLSTLFYTFRNALEEFVLSVDFK